MTFTLLPAVDIANGHCVRPAQGKADNADVRGDPLEAALQWQTEGADWVHLVDLDAAFGRGSNADLLASIIGRLDVKVELSGGIRDDAALRRALDTGCERIILGTAALADPEWCSRTIAVHGERIAVGLDVRLHAQADGSPQYRLAARGSSDDVGGLWETVDYLDREGCFTYVVTDVSRDGMLAGPNLELYGAITSATSTRVIASGGISAIDDLIALAKTATPGANLEGSIIGKALYAGRFTLAEALAAVRHL